MSDIPSKEILREEGGKSNKTRPSNNLGHVYTHFYHKAHSIYVFDDVQKKYSTILKSKKNK